jgi:hypothetical protein
MLVGAAVDPHFHAPLWLQTECKGHVLWFYNSGHMDFVEGYVSATLRERKPHAYKNKTLSSRLPTWMKLAKNREAVLKSIETLRTKV